MKKLLSVIYLLRQQEEKRGNSASNENELTETLCQLLTLLCEIQQHQAFTILILVFNNVLGLVRQFDKRFAMKWISVWRILLASLLFIPSDAFTTNRYTPLQISHSNLDTALNIADIQEAWTSYNQALSTNPYPTKIATGVVLAILGDAIAQIREPKGYDVTRAVSFAAFDGCWRAVQQVTYPPLVKLCQGQIVLGMLNTVGLESVATSSVAQYMGPLEQTLISQLVMIPTLYYPVFYAITGAVQGLTVEESITRAKETFIPIMKRNLLFWIPVQFVAFGFVEEDLQIPLLILCGLAWTVILSISAGAAKGTTDKSIDEEPLPEVAMSEIPATGLSKIASILTPNAKEREIEKVDR